LLICPILTKTLPRNDGSDDIRQPAAFKTARDHTPLPNGRTAACREQRTARTHTFHVAQGRARPDNADDAGERRPWRPGGCRRAAHTMKLQREQRLPCVAPPLT